ncbi:unnamed protein product [marine sediment metagenome]|uniref:Uncharacterized protein n=1 Tax=marine sediment metagenome TaxID=412755 RepID=X1DW28_9ZZZZ
MKKIDRCKDCDFFESKYESGCSDYCEVEQKEIKNIYRIPKWCYFIEDYKK